MSNAASKSLGLCAIIAYCAATASAQNVSQSGPLRISDLVSVSLNQGFLVIKSDYAPRQSAFSQSVEIQGIAEPAELLLERNAQGRLTKFGLTLTTIVDGKRRTEIISLTPEAIEVIRDDTDANHPDQPHSIELFQDAPGKRPRVELDRVDPDQTATELAQAPTFTQLVSHHPHLTNQFLRPIMQDDLQMEDVFGPSKMLAGIVLAAECPVDPAISRQVLALVEQFNSDSFADRETASRRLTNLGSDAVICLMSLDRAKLAPEQIVRVDEICRHARAPSPQEIAALRKDVAFLLKCQLSAERTLRLAALEVLQKAVGHEVKFDVDADFAARAAGVETLRGQLLRSPATSPSAN
jgi:hypothetical protein